jgi:hypothetical protein
VFAINFSLFLNTPIRQLAEKNVTAKWPLIGVGGVLFGKAGIGVGENLGKVRG